MKKYIIGVIAVLALLTGSYFTARYFANKRNQVNVDNIIALRDSVKHYKVEIGKLEYDVAEKGQIILSQKDAIKTGLLEKEALKRLNIKYLTELTSATLLVDILRDSIGHNGVVYIDSTTHRPSIGLPFTFGDTTKHYRFNGGFSITGKMSFKLAVPISLQVYTGIDRKGKAKATILTDNPYVTIGEITSLKVDVPKPKLIGFGATIGYGMVYVDNRIRFAPAIVGGVTIKF